MARLAHGCVAFYEPLTECKLRMFCFYGSGQSAVHLRHVKFPPGVERCIMEQPGRGLRGGEDLCSDLLHVAEELVELAGGLIDPASNPPFAVWAYSLGCAVAYEFVRAVRQQYDKEPLCMYLSVRRSPSVPVAPLTFPDGSAQSPDELLKGSYHDLLTCVAHYYGNSALQAMLDKLQGDPDADNADTATTRSYLFEKVGPLVHSDMKMGHSAASVFWEAKMEDDPNLTCELRAWAAGNAHDIDSSPDMVSGWQEVTDGPFTMVVVPEATHEGLLKHPAFLDGVATHVQTLVSSLEAGGGAR